MKPAVVFEKAPKWWPRVVIPVSTALLVVVGVLGLRQCGGETTANAVVEVDAGVPVSTQTPMVCDDCDAIAAAAKEDAEAASEETVERLKDALKVCVARKPAKGATARLQEKLRVAERKLAAAEARLARRAVPAKAKAKPAPAPKKAAEPVPADVPMDGPDVVAERKVAPAAMPPTRDKPRSLLEVIEAYEKSGH